MHQAAHETEVAIVVASEPCPHFRQAASDVAVVAFCCEKSPTWQTNCTRSEEKELCNVWPYAENCACILCLALKFICNVRQSRVGFRNHLQ